MFTEYRTYEMATVIERSRWNAHKFGTSGEVDSKEGVAIAEGLLAAPPNCSEVETPPVELNGAVGEALMMQPLRQCLRTTLIFDILFNVNFLTDGASEAVDLFADNSNTTYLLRLCFRVRY